MSVEERLRLELMTRVRDKQIKAARLLGLSVRQARRVWKRYRSDGDGGLDIRSRHFRPSRLCRVLA